MPAACDLVEPTTSQRSAFFFLHDRMWLISDRFGCHKSNLTDNKNIYIYIFAVAGSKKEGVGRRDIYGKVVRSRKSVAGWQLRNDGKVEVECNKIIATSVEGGLVFFKKK